MDVYSDPFENNRVRQYFRTRSNWPEFSDRYSSSLSPFVESHVDGTDKTPGKYTVSVPLGGNISPEDVKITLKNHILTIEAKKEKKTDDGNSSTRVYQEFTRKFTLPPNVDMKEVKSILSPEGYLKIEAPLPQPKEAEKPAGPKEIPIQVQ